MKSISNQKPFVLLFAVVCLFSISNSCTQKSPTVNTPLQWSETENIVWKTAVHGKGWSIPVIMDGRIWVTTATEDGKKMFAVCTDIETGEIVHDILILENEKPSWKNGNNTYATPSPVAKDGFVYTDFGTYGTACLDANSGEIVWKRTDINPERIIHGPASSPILYKNLMIVHHEATKNLRITALDIKTGATVWQVHRPEECYEGIQDDWRKNHSTPIIVTVNGKDQLISEGAQVCQSFDPETGEEIWRVCYKGHDSTVSSPISWNGMVYINTGLNSEPVELWAVNPDGKGDVTNTHVLWKCKEGVPGLPTPAAGDGLIYMIEEKGLLSCIDATSGELVWTQKLKGSFNATPVCVGDKVYVTGANGLTTVFKAGREFQLLSENQLDGRYVAHPVVYEDALIVRSDSHLYKIEI